MKTNKMGTKNNILYFAAGSAVFRLKRSFSAVVSLFRYSLETRPSGSDAQGCLTLHFADNPNEKRAKPLKTTLTTSVFRVIVLSVSFLLLSILPAAQAGSDIKAAPGGKDAQSAGTPDIRELLGTIGKKVSNFRSLKTDFVQEKDLAMFRKKIVLRGRIYMQKPGRLAWHVDKPVKYSVVITDKAIKQWDEDSNQVQEMSLSKNPIFKNVVNQLSVWFSGEYGGLVAENNVSVLQQHPLVLEFVPNEKNMARKMIKSITITFRDDEKYLKKIRIREVSGDTTTIEFSNTLLDVPVENSFFEVKRV